jgi:hypothetical protein
MDKNFNMAKTGDFIILIPEPGNWYAILDYRKELQESGFSVEVLDRFRNSPFHIIPEMEMNKLGWYKK